MSTPLSIGAEEYLSWLTVERGRSSNTIVSYRRDLVGWERWLHEAGIDPGAVRPDDLERFLEFARSQGRSAATITRALASLRGLYGFLY
ncbi:MAG: integrase/recombinase XerD, partial [Acidimicrobiaceae bacterium]|nr:integrase/recombinase XerD [Acidimicrobiaceae bacterium]